MRRANAFGSALLQVQDASLAVASGPNPAEALTGTVRPLTFHRAGTITIASGAQVVSDPMPVAGPVGRHAARPHVHGRHGAVVLPAMPATWR